MAMASDTHAQPRGQLVTFLPAGVQFAALRVVAIGCHCCQQGLPDQWASLAAPRSLVTLYCVDTYLATGCHMRGKKS